MTLKQLISTLALTTTFAAAAPDDALLFYCNFDGQADATYARGVATVRADQGAEFQPGVLGQAAVIGARPAADQEIVNGIPVNENLGLNYYYPSDGNFDMQQGTISFWMQPLDWDGDTPGFNVVFYTHAGPNYFQIYKFWANQHFQFVRGAPGQYPDNHYQLKDWSAGEWRHVAVTWNNNETRMYINAKRVCVSRVEHPLAPYEAVEPICIGAGGAWEKAFLGRTLIDEFRIHGRPLTDDEVATLYQGAAAEVRMDVGIITIGQRTPTLDGRIDDFEYQFTGTCFWDLDTRLVALEQPRYHFSYDRNNLYLGMESSVPGQAAEARIELLIEKERGAPLDRFTFTPDGAERPGATATSNITNGTWILEASIPWHALGTGTVPDGQTWRMNLARTEGDRTLCIAPVVARLDDRAQFLNLAFREEVPLVRIAGLYNMQDGISALDATARAPDPDTSVDIVLTQDNTLDYGYRTMKWDLFADGKQQSIVAPQPPRNTWKLEDFAILDVTVTAKTGEERETLFRSKLIHEKQDPLDTAFFYTRDKRTVVVQARQRAAGDMRLRFLRPDGTPAWTTSAPIPTDATFVTMEFDLDFTQLPPNEYTLKIDHVAPDGTATESYSQLYQVPAVNTEILKPYVDPEHDVVPPPWTPVKIGHGSSVIGPQSLVIGDRREAQTTDIPSRGGGVSASLRHSAFRINTWGRSHGLGDGFLFSSLVSQGEELLAAPMRLRLDGEELVLQGESHVVPISGSDMAAVVTKTAELGAVKVHSTITMHFDGYCEVAMTLAPAGDPVPVQSLSLDIPLRSAVGQLVRDGLYTPLMGSKAGAVGETWNQKLVDAPFFWVGNDQVGFNWLAEDLSDWHCRNMDKNVEILRQDGQAIVRLNLVDFEWTLDAPRTIHWGFCLTPSRPLDPKINRLRIGKDYQGWCQPWEYFAIPDYETADRDLIRAKGEGVSEVYLYLGIHLTSPFTPEWSFWEDEWRALIPKKGYTMGQRTLKYTSGGCLRSDTFVNWIMRDRAEFFEKARTPLTPKAINYYFDTGIGTSMCQNETHGCTPWTDAAGNRHGHMHITRFREVCLDTYRMIRRTGPDAKILSHYGWLRCMPQQHFVDGIVGGEGVEGIVNSEGSYYGLLTPEMFRATFSPYIYGMRMAFINMLVRGAKKSPKLYAHYTEDAEAMRANRHAYGYCVVHDVDMWDGYEATRSIREAVWAAQDALGWDENVVFHPYWQANAVKRIAPDNNRILASAYSKNGKLLLAVVNDTLEEQTVELQLDLKQLGVSAGAEATDAFTDRTYRLDSSWTDTIPPMEFRLMVWK